MTDRPDILVAGAGPVGLALALALTRHGIPVRVLERRTALSEASRASTFHPPTLEALASLGVLAPLLPGGVRVDRLLWRDVRSGAPAVLSLGLLEGETGFPFRWHREQREVTPALLAALPPGTVRFGAGVAALRQDSAGVEVVAEDGSTHRARFLVGCDGASGAVRGLAGIPAAGADYAHRVLRLQTPADLREHVEGLDGVGYLYDAEGSCSLLRMPGVWRIILRIPAGLSDEAAMAEGHARACLRRFLPGAGALPITGRDVYAVRRAMAERYQAGRVLLAGDAAHLTNTRGGMNMNAGLHDAMTLAAVLAGLPRNDEEARLAAWAAARLAVAREALLPRTDARVADDPGSEVARMHAIAAEPERARQWLREACMLDIAGTGAP